MMLDIKKYSAIILSITIRELFALRSFVFGYYGTLMLGKYFASVQ